MMKQIQNQIINNLMPLLYTGEKDSFSRPQPLSEDRATHNKNKIKQEKHNRKPKFPENTIPDANKSPEENLIADIDHLKKSDN